MTTGQLIKAARKNAGMTQDALGKKLGVSTSFIAQYETGKRKPKYDTLQRIAAALGVEWTELVPEDKQGTTIAAHVIEKAHLVVKGSGEKPMQKMSDAAAYRAGFLQFHSEEDRIVHFYNQLTDEGRIAAGGCFFRNLDKDALSKVADYVMNLSENPLYQRPTAPQSPPAPQEGKDTTPPPDAPETAPEGE